MEHVVFHKKCGLERTDMTPSAWINGQLKRFRAGLEAGISYLKRCFGLDRCNWRGWEHFQAYVHSAVFAHNLLSPGRPVLDHRPLRVQQPPIVRLRLDVWFEHFRGRVVQLPRLAEAGRHGHRHRAGHV